MAILDLAFCLKEPLILGEQLAISVLQPLNVSCSNAQICTYYCIHKQKESSGGVSKAYSALQYLEDNNDNVHLQSLHEVQLMSADRFALSHSGSLDRLQFLWLSRRSLQGSTHPTGV